MYSVCVVLLYSVSTVFGQTRSPPVFDPDCKDKLDSCSVFPDSSCQKPYRDWAKLNCRQRCGFCVGPTTPPPPCVDTVKNCADYTKSVCTKLEYKPWVGENCRAYCKEQFCTSGQISRLTTTTTTISPDQCYDRVDCRTFEGNACSKAYEGWAKDNCALYCGYCIGTPTTPPPCEDRIPNCKAYSPTMCSAPDYKIWVDDNCRKFCGKC